MPLRNNFTTKFYIVKDSWSILGAIEAERNKNYTHNYQTIQNSLDPEQYIHNQDLYSVWNSKPYILYRIAKLNPFNSTFFLFTDSGAFRERYFDNWPDTEFISQNLAPKLNNRILLGQINIRESFSEINAVIQGTFFGGSAQAVKQFYSNFFYVHDELFKRGKFVGKEQNIMDHVAFRNFNDTVIRLQTWNLSCTFEYEGWFFYQVIIHFLKMIFKYLII
jgi:hypothetical protein